MLVINPPNLQNPCMNSNNQNAAKYPIIYALFAIDHTVHIADDCPYKCAIRIDATSIDALMSGGLAHNRRRTGCRIYVRVRFVCVCVYVWFHRRVCVYECFLVAYNVIRVTVEFV